MEGKEGMPEWRRNLFDYAPDMEYLEIVGPAEFGTVDAPGPCPEPPVTPWSA